MNFSSSITRFYLEKDQSYLQHDMIYKSTIVVQKFNTRALQRYTHAYMIDAFFVFVSQVSSKQLDCVGHLLLRVVHIEASIQVHVRRWTASLTYAVADISRKAVRGYCTNRCGNFRQVNTTVCALDTSTVARVRLQPPVDRAGDDLQIEKRFRVAIKMPLRFTSQLSPTLVFICE